MPKPSRDDVIAAIYAAAVEPDALGRIAYLLRSSIDADSAGLWLIEGDGIRDMTQTADIAESIDPYLAYYRTLDPWATAPKTPGRVYLGSDSVDEGELVGSEFYQDFARRFGMLRPMGLTFDLQGGTLATIAINRTEARRLLGEADRAALQDLAVHVKGALTLRGRILADRTAIGTRGSVFDAVSFGVVVCNEDAVVRAANEAGYELAQAGLIGLGGRGRGLAGGSIAETRRLHALIRAAAAGQPGAMRFGHEAGRGLSVLVTPTIVEGRTYALVCLRRDDAAASLDAPTLARLFKLSPAQSELCVLLVAGLTFEEAAAQRGIATSTARSYFLAILDRTGARNLRDLLRLLGSLPQVG